ncbi:hypothetical protein D3093_26865 (plasmid) [Azospirillum argentinense]|uniref:Uncharacterized protein n=1 Tax=Azospirillum argentinense TaxID=2970906 RepID=A0A4D8PVH4_9PROT|nr:HI1506-related protein [Azospirillum argentinense]QCN98909.1 hypothetical protein D3093_26865 [Azospirillum argentinense]
MTPALRIQARPAAGIRRCGVRHPAVAVEHPPGAFTPGQVETLLRDPDLIVTEIAAAEAVELLSIEASVPVAELLGAAMPASSATDVAPGAEEGAAPDQATGEAGADGAPASSSEPTAPATPQPRARKAKD